MSKSDQMSPRSYNLRQRGIELSNKFAQMEGRRPRILIGRAVNSTTDTMNKICNTFADMGSNVDVAPTLGKVEELAKQCLENDADIVLLLGADNAGTTELKNLYELIVANHPEIILSLLLGISSSSTDTFEARDKYIVFSMETDIFEMGLSLLEHLLGKSS